jgi:lambda family phage portal protein
VAANPFAAASDLQWGGTNAFRGATPGRLSMDRLGSASHPNSEVRYSLRELRARARDLVRNNPYAAGIVSAFADNIIGWEGIRLRPRVTLPNGDQARTVNWEIERGWKEWDAEYATVDGVESWVEHTRLAVKSWVTDGEIFERRRRGWDNPHGFAVELIDPDLLDEDFNQQLPGGREIVMGIEMDAHGRRLAYHFWKHHPDEMGRRERQRIDASEITHLFSRYRTGQARGYSMFAPVLTTIEMIDGLTEAELVASRYHASKMGFITSNTPEAVNAYATRLALQNQQGRESEPRRVRIGPGIVEELIPGQSFESFDPQHPNDAFEAFLKVMHMGVARAFGLSYLTLTGDVGEANYSSMRAGLLPERDNWKVLQELVSRRLHRPVYRDWLGMALLSGALDLPSPVASQYQAHEWRGRRWQWVDPSNDLEAFEREVRLGINSRQRGAAERGLDFETLIDETADDLDYAGQAGVDVAGMGNKSQPVPAPTVPGTPTNGNGNGNGRPSAGRLTLAPYTEATHGD